MLDPEQRCSKLTNQSPIMYGQFITTLPRLDESGDAVILRGVFTFFQNRHTYSTSCRLMQRLSQTCQSVHSVMKLCVAQTF